MFCFCVLVGVGWGGGGKSGDVDGCAATAFHSNIMRLCACGRHVITVMQMTYRGLIAQQDELETTLA